MSSELPVIDVAPATEMAVQPATSAPQTATAIAPRKDTRFKKGVVMNPLGRPKGHSVVTLEIKAAARLIVDDLTYRNNLLSRARKGKLPPPVEVLLWHYAHGVPKITMDVNAKVVDVTKMATDELRDELAALLERL